MLSGISFGILSGIRGYCVFSLSLWHSISPRRLWSRSGGHHSDPGFAVEVRRGEEDKKEERSGWHRISQPGTCRWRDNTNKVKEAHGSTIQAAQSLSAMVFYSIKGHGHAVWSSKGSKKWVNLNHLNLSVWTEPLPVAPSKTPSFCTITEKRFMSAVMQSRGQFVSSHFDCSSYTMQGKNNFANLTMPFYSPGQRARGPEGLQVSILSSISSCILSGICV